MPKQHRKPLGFVILSHANPDQVLRLIRTLNQMYNEPPIAWHHDFSQSTLGTRKLPPNVSIVRPSLRTGWGKFSVVQSFLSALNLLYQESDPDWFCLLSGADYPTAKAEVVLDQLQRATCDAFLDVHQLDNRPAKARLVGNWNPELVHLETDEQYRTKDRFYNRAQFWLPIIRQRPQLRLGRLTFYLPFRARIPYHEGYGLYWGDHWFTANRRAAKLLRSPTEHEITLQRHLKRRAFPEESYYQTVLCNSSELTICRDNKRFVQWNGGGAHPMTLTDAEVPIALASGAHFGRKFAPNSPALDSLDDALLS